VGESIVVDQDRVHCSLKDGEIYCQIDPGIYIKPHSFHLKESGKVEIVYYPSSFLNEYQWRVLGILFFALILGMVFLIWLLEEDSSEKTKQEEVDSCDP